MVYSFATRRPRDANMHTTDDDINPNDTEQHMQRAIAAKQMKLYEAHANQLSDLVRGPGSLADYYEISNELRGSLSQTPQSSDGMAR